MRKLTAQRGGILPYALIILATMATAMSVLIALQNARTVSLEALRIQRESDLLVSSTSRAVEGAVVQSIRAGDMTQAPVLVKAAVAGLKTEHWASITTPATWNVGPSNDGPDSPNMSALPYERQAALEMLDPPPPLLSWIGQMPVRRYRFNFDAQMDGVPNQYIPGPIQRKVTFTTTVIEIPTVAFAFVATAQPFDEANSHTNVQVNGLALFNAGVIRPVGSNPTVSAGSLVLGGTVGQNLNGLHSFPYNGKASATWGLSSWSDYLSPNGTGNAAQVSRCHVTIPNQLVINWDIPELDPQPTPPFGITRAPNIAGKPRLVIDLRQYTTGTGAHIYINCTSDATKAAGVVVVGEPQNSALPAVSVTTNGQLTLMGDNVRSTFISSGYNNTLQLLSSAYRDNPVPNAGSGLSWRGYLHIPKPGMVCLSPAENWSNATFTVNGTVAYMGGPINGIGQLVINQSPENQQMLAPTSNTDTAIPLSDRVSITSVSPR